MFVYMKKNFKQKMALDDPRILDFDTFNKDMAWAQ